MISVSVSLTAAPEKEVRAGVEILRALGLRPNGPAVTSCPTCGRTKVDVPGVAARVEEELERLFVARGRPARFPRVAVMGCAVNGPGEAKGADIALCGGDGGFVLYADGTPVARVSEEDAVSEVMRYAIRS